MQWVEPKLQDTVD
ncbi:hypothetical protein F383_33455 [Gossypium arboreum]|uniref:Uncharacterized protein n=1 Tax=Gossypium arboreum TaxID=29729 RepID=A0A0B0PU51_GOSAR|nr:hypothetical protein F383_33455 [Gossypium arboreum]